MYARPLTKERYFVKGREFILGTGHGILRFAGDKKYNVHKVPYCEYYSEQGIMSLITDFLQRNIVPFKWYYSVEEWPSALESIFYHQGFYHGVMLEKGCEDVDGFVKRIKDLSYPESLMLRKCILSGFRHHLICKVVVVPTPGKQNRYDLDVQIGRLSY